MPNKEISEQKFKILLHMHSVQFDELNFRRTREFRIFQWSSYVFIALIGILISIDKSKTLFWDNLGLYGKIISTITILVFIVFSIIWQNRERKFGHENQQIIAKINKLLFVFDEGNFGLNENETLFINNIRWKNWGNTKLNNKKRFFRGNFITATWLLGILTILMIWFT
jgi:hypothetical protein